ncbi:MAG: hypothetical protein COB01_08295 [Lutibacter sp.]|nr:MAG: hypothetical protein COB01_08295 [Lutibacter sp.]
MHNSKPIFSIVIANYNHGEFFEKAILSILNQSCQDFELIIIDGGSTDNSVNIIKKYEAKLAWWISEKDKGQSDAFNKGFGKAKGEFFFWLNADDVLLPDSLEKAIKVISKYDNIEWFAANTIFFDVNGIITKCTNGPSWNNFLFKNAPITIYGPTSIFSKKIFDKVGGFDESLYYGMDTDLWLRFRSAGYKFKRIPAYFWGFRIHKDSKTSHSFSEKPSKSYSAERKRILKKNKINYIKRKIFFQQIYKIFSGLYLKSLIDTHKYKGNFIKNINI